MENKNAENLPMRKSSEQSPKDLACISPSDKIIKTTDGQYFMSLYNGDMPKPEDYAIAVKRLSCAFPRQDMDFFKIAVEEMADMGFTAERMKDAVANVIRNFRYKELNVADIVSFDRKRKLYTHGQMLAKLVCNGGTEKSTDSFRKVDIDGQTFWYLPSENML